ncbi:MAG: HdaA/DnaA family protein [Sphingomonadaceae bacterium]
MNQIALPLDWPADDTGDAFIVTPSNAEAVRRIHAFGTWPVCAMILTGPRKSGRSLFGRSFAAGHRAALIDDAETRDEAQLFNAWNDAQAKRRPLLIIANAPPPIWPIALPDLRSRLNATPHVRFGDPDEALMFRLLAAQIERRGIVASPNLLAYLVPRIERSHRALLALVDRLDAASLSRRRAITVPLARDVLAQGVDGHGAVDYGDAR